MTFFGLSLLSLLFFSNVYLVSFGCGYGCRALAWIFAGIFPFFPFAWICLVLVWLCLLSLQFLCFSSVLLLLFSSGFPASTWFGCVSQVLFFVFLFEVFLSDFEIDFEIPFSCHPFFFLGVEVWLGPSVFSPALGSVDSSLGSGKIRSAVLVWAVSCSASFSSACGSDRTLEFLRCEEVFGGPQVVLILGLSDGAAAPSLFHA